MSNQRLILAVLLAPFIVVPINLITAVVEYLHVRQRPPRDPDIVAFPDPSNPLRYIVEWVGIFSYYGVLAAFLTLILVWLPIFKLLTIFKLVNPFTIITLSLGASVPVIIILEVPSFGPFLTAMMFVHGLALGYTFLLIAGYGLSPKEPQLHFPVD